jgi:hypothetical protein
MILEKLGSENLPTSYIKYIIGRLTGYDANPHVTDVFTMIFFLAALVVSLFLNIRDLTGKSGKKI